jgi:hypothetical protein
VTRHLWEVRFAGPGLAPMHTIVVALDVLGAIGQALRACPHERVANIDQVERLEWGR